MYEPDWNSRPKSVSAVFADWTTQIWNSTFNFQLNDGFHVTTDLETGPNKKGVKIKKLVIEKKSSNDQPTYKSTEEFITPITPDLLGAKGEFLTKFTESLIESFSHRVFDSSQNLHEGAWEPAPRQRIPDLSYARFAALYFSIFEFGSSRPLNQIAELTNVSYEGAKMRIRIARDRGLLFQVGKGKRFEIELTEEAKELLRSNQESWRFE